MSFRELLMNLNLSAFASGLTLGLGLIVSQMINPVKVLSFLDVAGNWDPSLALVMAGALLTLGFLQWLIRKSLNQHSHSANTIKQANPKQIDAKLIIGSSLFGIGWGLSGLCPGPALSGLTSGLLGSYVFVATLFIGFLLFNKLHRKP